MSEVRLYVHQHGACISNHPCFSFEDWVRACRLVPSFVKNTPPWDPTVGRCLGFLGGPRGLGIFLWARYLCTPAAQVYMHKHGACMSNR
jgi:hypothetical protein